MGDEGNNNDDLKDINKNQIGASSSTTLKTKIQSLEKTIEEVHKAINDNITDIKELEKEKNEHKE